MTEAKFCDISNHQPSTRAYIQAIKDWGAKAVVLIIVGRKSPYFSEGLDSPSLRQ